MKTIFEPPDNISYSKLSHWDYFRSKGFDTELRMNDPDYRNSGLKAYQDLLIYSFIKEFIKKGSKILEIGAGYPRILPLIKNDYECWVLDKYEGIGNGTKEIPHIEGIRFVIDHIGAWNKTLPYHYFDLVFSISVMEHSPEDSKSIKDIFWDIQRLLKNGGYVLHSIDTLIKENTIKYHKLIEFTFKNEENIKLTHVITNFEEFKNNGDLYFLTEEEYNKDWIHTIKVEYSKHGIPFVFNLFYMKNGN